jgi:hypothetical protein
VEGRGRRRGLVAGRASIFWFMLRRLSASVYLRCFARLSWI